MRKIWLYLLIILLIAAFTLGAIPAFGKHHTTGPRQSEYAIYLSPRPSPNVAWGGYHVTVTSFSDHHAPGKSEKAEARKAWNKVHGHGSFYFDKKQRGKDYWAQDLGNGYGICFKSRQLDRMTQELHNRKFDNQKQLDNVNNGRKCRWHISLYCKTREEAISMFENDLKNRPWKLYEVRSGGSAWKEI